MKSIFTEIQRTGSKRLKAADDPHGVVRVDWLPAKMRNTLPDPMRVLRISADDTQTVAQFFDEVAEEDGLIASGVDVGRRKMSDGSMAELLASPLPSLRFGFEKFDTERNISWGVLFEALSDSPAFGGKSEVPYVVGDAPNSIGGCNSFRMHFLVGDWSANQIFLSQKSYYLLVDKGYYGFDRQMELVHCPIPGAVVVAPPTSAEAQTVKRLLSDALELMWIRNRYKSVASPEEIKPTSLNRNRSVLGVPSFISNHAVDLEELAIVKRERADKRILDELVENGHLTTRDGLVMVNHHSVNRHGVETWGYARFVKGRANDKTPELQALWRAAGALMRPHPKARDRAAILDFVRENGAEGTKSRFDDSHRPTTVENYRLAVTSDL